MAETRFTKDHEWVRLEGDIATVGITDYAQHALGDVVFVELPDVGKALTQGKDAAVVESVKAASEVYAPIDGEVTEVNEALAADPAQVNQDPTGSAWFFKMKVTNPAQVAALLDQAAYDQFVGELG
jgi:glycine cleavage system H protein